MAITLESPNVKTKISTELLMKAYKLMCTAKSMSDLYDCLLYTSRCV